MRRQIRAIASMTFAVAAVQLLAAPAMAQTFVPGTPVFGANDYIEYIPGNLPIIVSAPHGGALVTCDHSVADGGGVWRG